MTLTVVGSIAFDSVRTPFGERERMLGGSAVHFSLAASFFTDVRVVGPVGDDFGEREYATLHERGIDTSDIEQVAGGRTFFWRGHYDFDLNSAHTEATELNVFADFQPKLSPASRDADVLFLANIEPGLQREVRDQCTRARFVAMDSMNYWIDAARESLVDTITSVDAVLLNDAELRMLTGEPNRLRAARAVLAMGPRVVVAKQGEYGVMLFTEQTVFGLPAYPLETVLDPTGAGDSFAGGFVGYLAAHPGADDDIETLKRAVAYGTALASFNVEQFGTERVRGLSGKQIVDRVGELERITSFADVPVALRG
jgi:sugar/nucleoside kinase (ribokinase family)